MFIRLSTILFSAVALVGVATAAPSTGGVYTCEIVGLRCCNNTYPSNSTYVTNLFGSLGIPVPSNGGLVGFGCSPYTGIGTGVGSTCVTVPLCCTGNTFNGLINYGCSPITIIG